jgi:hypothetical protein
MTAFNKADLIFNYLKEFKRIGNYFGFTDEQSTCLYLERLDLFRNQLNQYPIIDEKTAKKMFYELTKSIFDGEKRQIRDKNFWQIQVITITDKPSRKLKKIALPKKPVNRRFKLKISP